MQEANSQISNIKRQISKARWRRWTLVVAWMGVIIIISAQPDQALNFGQTTLVSKLAHVGEYAILGACIQWALGARPAWPAWLMTLAYAATDEFHQTFVPGRTARVTDVLIDAAGAAAGIALALWRS